MEIYRFLLDLLPTNHASRLTIVCSLNRLANRISQEIDDFYKPNGDISSRDYPKASTQISAFDVDDALNLITRAENSLHRKNVRPKEKRFSSDRIRFSCFSFLLVAKLSINSKSGRSFLVLTPIVSSFDLISTIYNQNSFSTTVRSEISTEKEKNFFRFQKKIIEISIETIFSRWSKKVDLIVLKICELHLTLLTSTVCQNWRVKFNEQRTNFLIEQDFFLLKNFNWRLWFSTRWTVISHKSLIWFYSISRSDFIGMRRIISSLV